jgi:hypothetical protein
MVSLVIFFFLIFKRYLLNASGKAPIAAEVKFHSDARKFPSRWKYFFIVMQQNFHPDGNLLPSLWKFIALLEPAPPCCVFPDFTIFAAKKIF